MLCLLWLHPFILSGVISPLISRSTLGAHRPGQFLFQCPLFAFSYCSWGSQGRNTEVACHSLLQWATFCQSSRNELYWFRDNWPLLWLGKDGSATTPHLLPGKSLLCQGFRVSLLLDGLLGPTSDMLSSSWGQSLKHCKYFHVMNRCVESCAPTIAMEPSREVFLLLSGLYALSAHQPVGRPLPHFPQQKDLCSRERKEISSLFLKLFQAPTYIWPLWSSSAVISMPIKAKGDEWKLIHQDLTLYPTCLCCYLSKPVVYLGFCLLEMKIFSPMFNQEKFQNIVERNL